MVDEQKPPGDEKDYAEKRRHPRVRTHLEVDFSSGEELVSSYISNISKGGVFITTFNPLDLGAEVLLSIRIPGQDHRIRIKGKVVWNSPAGGDRKPGMGIQFEEIADEDRYVLDGFIEAQLSKAGDPS